MSPLKLPPAIELAGIAGILPGQDIGMSVTGAPRM